MRTKDWICRSCGSNNAAQFAHCTECGLRGFAHGAELDVAALDKEAVSAAFLQFQGSGQALLPQPRPVRDFLNRHLWIKYCIALLLFIPGAVALVVFVVARDPLTMCLALAAFLPITMLAAALGIERPESGCAVSWESADI
ncbi:hypothetical protein [Massilia sp. CF038]|uniref:hypothetical protein n=1 Tax=Massilia sp. CF038 TaxID=1881045 RepID=UPI0009206820|nr:hypothetical protein [Massilia sp. CF038]SHH24203.1 hypothetical protein SAMN05428948_3477 [Massilia sp. CF038]